MKTFAINVIWITSLALPYFVFILHNNFQHSRITILRALIAIGLGWVFMIAYAISASSITVVEKISRENLNAVTPNDGASLAFVSVFGWLIPSFVVFIAWLFHRWVLPKMRES